MKIFNYYKKAIIYPSIFIVCFCVMYAVIDNYMSDWTVIKEMIAMSAVSSLIYVIIVSVLSVTMYLNKYEIINRNIVWNIVTWFLLPLGYIAIVLFNDISNRVIYGFGFGSDFVYLLIMILPFVAGLCWTFIAFRKRISASQAESEELH